jgi:hypothetical protein
VTANTSPVAQHREVDPSSAEQIATAISKYFRQPSLRRETRARRKAQIRELFARENVWPPLTKFCLSVN